MIEIPFKSRIKFPFQPSLPTPGSLSLPRIPTLASLGNLDLVSFFKYFLILILISYIIPGHHHVTMDVDKPIKQLIPSSMSVNATSKTLVEMIEMYVNGTTVDELQNKLNITQEVIDALNMTSFKV